MKGRIMNKEENIFQVAAVVPSCGIKTMADKGVRIFVDTRELSNEDKSKLFGLQGERIWVAFAKTTLRVDDLNIKEVEKEFLTDKTPSQRLRSVLYVYWQDCTDQQEPFETFYKAHMEKFIDIVKNKLPER